MTDLKDIVHKEISNIDTEVTDLCQAVCRLVIDRAQRCIESDGETSEQYTVHVFVITICRAQPNSRQKIMISRKSFGMDQNSRKFHGIRIYGI